MFLQSTDKQTKTKQSKAEFKDYQKSLPAANITTNDVYYKRQLTSICFNVHNVMDLHIPH